MSDCNDVEMNRRNLPINKSIYEWLSPNWYYNSERNYVVDLSFLTDYDFNVEMFVGFLDEECFSKYFEVHHAIEPLMCSDGLKLCAIELTHNETLQLSDVPIKDFLNYRKVEIAKKPSYEEDSCSDMDNAEELLSERNTTQYREWRNMILIRDGVCQCCGHNKHLHVHHIYGFKKYPDLRYNEDNGITFCKWCHEKYHSIYGRKNPNPVTFGKYMRKYGVKL